MSLKVVEWDPAKPWRVDISLVSKDLAGRYPKPGGKRYRFDHWIQYDVVCFLEMLCWWCVFGDFTHWWMSGFSLGIFCRKSPDFHCCRSFRAKNKQTRKPFRPEPGKYQPLGKGEKLTQKAPKLRFKMFIFGGVNSNFNSCWSSNAHPL